MKKLFILLLAISLAIGVFSQPPRKMSYQAVIRNASGALVTNHAVGIRISILQGSASGTVVYAETYSPVPQTNANGLVTVEIGSGTPSTGTFAGINWTAGPYFLKTETDPTGGTSYTITGTSQLLSVPYALFSGTSDQLNMPFSNTSGYSGGFNFSITNSSASAIRGIAASSTGSYYGVYGQSLKYGVYGVSTGTQGRSVAGEATGTASIGVYGVAVAESSTGVWGEGSNQGVYGTSELATGRGVYGRATSTTGTNYGIYGQTNSSSGYSGYFTGGRFYISGNVGIGTNAPSTTLHVNGQIRITGGSPAAGRVLTSDATGLATWQATTEARKYQVGDFAHGGIIFWLDETGQHGLVCAKIDQSTGVRWYAGYPGNTRAYGDGPLAGKANTSIIIAAQVAIGDDGNTYAARICNELQITEGGKTYGDWYLPSEEELNLMYQNRTAVNTTATANGGKGFASAFYWSSTEYANHYAWGQDYENGAQYHAAKYSTYRVRAVRAF